MASRPAALRAGWVAGVALAVTLLAPAGLDAAPAREMQPVLLLVESTDGPVTLAVREGMALASSEGPAGSKRVLRLRRVPPGGTWQGSTASITEALADCPRAILIAPPEPRLAGLVAQIGTKAHVPVLALDGGPALEASGSWWVTAVPGTGPMPAPVEAAYLARTGHAAGPVVRAAWRAGRLVSDTLAGAGRMERTRLAQALRAGRDLRVRALPVARALAAALRQPWSGSAETTERVTVPKRRDNRVSLRLRRRTRVVAWTGTQLLLCQTLRVVGAEWAGRRPGGQRRAIGGITGTGEGFMLIDLTRGTMPSAAFVLHLAYDMQRRRAHEPIRMDVSWMCATRPDGFAPAR